MKKLVKSAEKPTRTILSYFKKIPNTDNNPTQEIIGERCHASDIPASISSSSVQDVKSSKHQELSLLSEISDVEVKNGTPDNEGNPPKRMKISVTDIGHEQGKQRLIQKSRKFVILDENMGLTWFMALEKEFDKEYFTSLNSFVTNAREKATVFPPVGQVWEWTRHCNIRDTKVVILGQDPYHGTGQAHGLCFSVINVVPPPSLVNMYNELKTDIPGFEAPNHGCLIGWASQGVLLLNAVLTVTAHQANSHKDKGWEKITDATISWISQNLSGVVFLLWGAYAQKKAAVVDKKKHHLLQTVHPSPLSVHRGFFGCKHFSKCNDLLKKNGKTPIDWNHLPKP